MVPDLPEPGTEFLQGAGDLGALMRAYDWTGTPLGPPARWPQSLKTTVSTVLRSPVPMVLLWGPDGIMIYNDAYSVFAAGRHPRLLGSKVLEGWPEVAVFNAHVIQTVMGGGSLTYRDQELTLHRRGAPEQVWMNLDYGPVLDESGRPGGVLAIVAETTNRVLAERRVAEEGQRLRAMFEQAPGLITMLRGPDHVFDFANTAYLELMGHREIIGRPVREALPELAEQGFVAILDRVYATGEPFIGTRMPTAIRRQPDAPLETRYFDFVYQPVVDAQGRVAGIYTQGHDVTDAKLSEAALRESEARFRLFSEESREGVVVHDGRVILDCNSAYVRMFGYASLQDLVGREITDTLAPESIPTARSKIRDRVEEPFEVVSRRKDGSTLPAEIVAREGTWKGRRVRIVLVRDLTDAKRRETELRESEAHLSALFNQAAAGISEADLTGRFLRVNDRFCEIVGRTEAELLSGLRMQEITHPDDLPDNLVLFRRAVETGQPFEIEKRYIQPDGQVVWVSNSVTLIQDAKGRPLNIAAVTVDVTARKQAEAALRQSEERHRALFDQAAVGVAHLRLDGRWIAANQKLCDILGYSYDELVTHSFQSITHPDDRESDLRFVAALDAGEVPAFRREKRYLRKDGSAVWVEVNVSLIRDPSGAPLHRLVIIQDVQDRKRWEEHQRLLINELNHRVKNTLATVQSVAAQTLRNAPSAQDARNALESRLLALSRAHDVLTRESWEGANLDEIVAQAVAPYSHPGENRLHVSGPPVRLSPRMALALAMALQELATNAVKHGALSNVAGAIRIAWSLKPFAGEHRLHLTWAESGGPPVREPTRRGFGTRLIERSLAQDLGGEVRMTFAPTGLVCTVDAPLPPS